MMQAARAGYVDGQTLYMAMELSNRTWMLGFSNGEKTRRKSVDSRNRSAVLNEIRAAKEKLRLPAQCRVVICYEAGRDGHWIYHWLTSEGFEVLEMDSSSIETARRKHRKSDRLDVEKLLDLLMRYCHGYRKAFRVVRVPPAEAEAEQRLHREDEYLKKQRTRVVNRIKSLLVTQGVAAVPLRRGFESWLESVRLWNGEGLSAQLHSELLRLYEQYKLLSEQSKTLSQQYAQEVKSDSRVGQQRQQLELLKGVGAKSSRVLTGEAFSWRTFDNAKQVGAMSGLVPTPHRSGEQSREQGISKVGSSRLRSTMVELAWMWLRWQPESALSRWFNEKFARGGKRSRRIGIVALARKLLIALWKYLEHGLLPDGAIVAERAPAG